MPYAGTGAMQRHLAEIAREAAPGSHGLVILDKAARHTTTKLKVPANPSPACLPPAAPELNPQENIWQYLRQTCLSNRIFESCTAIPDACQNAWRKLLEESGRIKSIATRSWVDMGVCL